jgi:hypothetical protein
LLLPLLKSKMYVLPAVSERDCCCVPSMWYFPLLTVTVYVVVVATAMWMSEEKINTEDRRMAALSSEQTQVNRQLAGARTKVEFEPAKICESQH